MSYSTSERDELAKRRRKALKTFAEAIPDNKPYVTGTVALPLSDFRLFYDAPDSTKSLNLAQATAEQLQALADACAPATFGLGPNDVLDESYRKASKMDASQFTTRIVPERTSLADTIRGHLLDESLSNRPITFELYKLNVYGEGSFFKTHVDTPRGTHMFGSLVLIFPTPHEGGNLILRHDGKEFNFDSASAARHQTEPSVAFAAFFSDVEHEVLPVTAGQRVSITFNLYYGDVGEDTQATPQIFEKQDAFKRAFEAVLADDELFDHRLALGFPLQHAYPISVQDKNLSLILRALKGTDATIYAVCHSMGFEPKVYLRYIIPESWGSPSEFLLDRPMDFTDREINYEEDGMATLVRKYHGIVVRNPGGYRSPDELVYWVSEPKVVQLEDQAYMAYGNEHQMMYAYRDLYLIVRIGPPGARVKGEADDGQMDDFTNKPISL